MIIKKIKLDNIRSYTNQEINFPDGSTLLSGDIGSGKSSILLAIEFALFGSSRSDLPGTSLLRNGAKKGSVELHLNIDNKGIIIKRTLKRSNDDVKQDTGYIIVDDVRADLSPVELRSHILSLISYPSNLITKSKDLIYRYTVYTPQEEMRRILLENKDDRLDTLRKVFGIDKYKVIRENSQLFIKTVKERKKFLSLDIETIGEVDKQKKEKESLLQDISQKISTLAPDIKVSRLEIDSQKKLLELLEKRLAEYLDMKRQLEHNGLKLKEKIELNENNKKELESLDVEINKLILSIDKIKTEDLIENEKELEKSLSLKEKEFESLTAAQSNVKESIAGITAQISQIESWLADNSKKVLSLADKEKRFLELANRTINKDSIKKNILLMEKEIQEIIKVIKELEVNISNSKKLKSRITELDNCPTCSQKVGSEHKHHVISTENNNLALYLQDLELAENRHKTMLKDFSRIKNDFERVLEEEKLKEALNFELKTLKQLDSEMKQKSDNLLKLRENYNGLNSKLVKDDIIKQYKQEIVEVKLKLSKVRENNSKIKEKGYLKNILEDKHKQREKLSVVQGNIKKEIGVINSRKIELNERIKDLFDVEKKFKTEKANLDNLIAKLHLLEKEEISYKKEVEGIQNIIAQINKELDKKLQSKNRLKHLDEMQNWLENYFINLTHTMEKQVMLRVYHEFNEIFINWFNMLIEDESVNARLDEEFSPVIEQNGYETLVQFLSGGEKTACALAYRLALNKVINDVMSRIKTKDLIILDEPTDGFSSQQLDRVRDVLDQLNMKQVIIVSHESKIESFVNNVIRVEKREHVSEVLG